MTSITHLKHLELILHPHEPVELKEAHARMAIECKQGMLWITSDGDLGDHLLTAGERFTPKKRGKIIIEALRDACLCVSDNDRQYRLID
ncbi:MAG: DUF2917 domain-containing protein [Chloroflexi bacterium]|nr:DUF2917 domain-containing protein [Chloroflexota bacterium]